MFISNVGLFWAPAPRGKPVYNVKMTTNLILDYMNKKEAEKGPGKKPAAFKSAGLSKTHRTLSHTWKHEKCFTPQTSL